MPATETATATVCSRCDAHWALVLTSMRAHPGRAAADGRWTPAGPTAYLSADPDAGGTTHTYRWACLCGAPMVYADPAVDLLPCRHNAGPDGVCRKAAARRTASGYVLPSTHAGAWQACACCGHQGSHWVRRDPSADRPACYA